jgi:hypothetical protein
VAAARRPRTGQPPADHSSGDTEAIGIIAGTMAIEVHDVVWNTALFCCLQCFGELLVRRRPKHVESHGPVSAEARDHATCYGAEGYVVGGAGAANDEQNARRAALRPHRDTRLPPPALQAADKGPRVQRQPRSGLWITKQLPYSTKFKPASVLKVFAIRVCRTRVAQTATDPGEDANSRVC